MRPSAWAGVQQSLSEKHLGWGLQGGPRGREHPRGGALVTGGGPDTGRTGWQGSSGVWEGREVGVGQHRGPQARQASVCSGTVLTACSGAADGGAGVPDLLRAMVPPSAGAQPGLVRGWHRRPWAGVEPGPRSSRDQAACPPGPLLSFPPGVSDPPGHGLRSSALFTSSLRFGSGVLWWAKLPFQQGRGRAGA